METALHSLKLLRQTDSLNKILEDQFEEKSFCKGDFLYKQGDICRHLFYIQKGLVRVYYISASGKEITSWFAAENMVVTDLNSFYYHKPASDFCEILEESIVIPVNYSKLELLLDSHHGARLAFYVLYEATLKLTEYINRIKFQSARERYETLIQDYPSITQRTSLSHIASYLGITQETLSRIRGNLTSERKTSSKIIF
jgi:CRP/FNR family transcriptional regulator, anaerobic regulatory protein